MTTPKNLSFSTAVTGHLLWCESVGYSPHTVSGYRVAFNLFQNWLGVDKPFAKITRADIEGFMAWAIKTPVTPGGCAPRPTRTRRPKTVANYHIALSALWTWAISHDYTKTHIVQSTQAPKVHHTPIEYLTTTEITKMIQGCRQSRPWHNKPLTTTERATAIRDKMIVCLLVETGLRASEACSLLIENIQFTNPGGKIKVIEGKGKKDRIVPFGKRLADILAHYLGTRPNAKPTDYLLINELRNKDHGMTREYLGRLIKRIGERVEIKNVHPHKLRTTAACHMLINGMSIRDVQHILGHGDIKTTQKYVEAAHIDLVKAILTASPLDRLRL